MQTIAALLQITIAAGLPRNEAQYLMLHACGQDSHDRAWLIAHGDDQASAEHRSAWQSFVKRRLQGEPVAYIVGHKAFYGLRLKVSPAVLDPRDDTETLVDWALELLPSAQACKVLDLGTGSGAVGLAIASQRPLAQMTATDASPEALEVARRNAAAYKLVGCFVLAELRAPHWFSALAGQVYDLIVSNPPYIAEGDSHLTALKHEPAMALTSGKDGLDAIRSIISHAPAHLSAAGHLLLEHGYDQAAAVRALFEKGSFVNITTRQDLSGTERCTGAQWMGVKPSTL